MSVFTAVLYKGFPKSSPPAVAVPVAPSASAVLEDVLVAATQAGDRTAFESIYSTYYDRIYRYVLVRIGHSTEAEDIAADVFLRALEAIASYNSRGVPFAAWLFRIAHNLVVDHLRRRSRRPTSVLDESLPLLDEAPDDRVVAGLAVIDVLEVMPKITDAQRQVLALRFGAGLSVAETAAVMKKKDGAVKALQHSAIGALRRHLAKRGHEVPGQAHVEPGSA
ncbi:MAG: sigma-70 family RNA polymerase sigma factor [Chloroflexi bacterium]|nr:sigma-70 family RNA polymerase sigma factor [Chloroflexota bacterium]